MIEAVLFDNDGVLVETEHLYFEASREILAERGIALDLEQFREISLTRGQSLIELARETGADDAEVRELAARRDDRYVELLERGIAPIDGVVALLERLRPHYRLAIVTTSLRRSFETAHRGTGLVGRFDLVLTREDYGRAKPHPEPYLTAAKRFGLEPEACLVVEDTERGLASAVAAEMRCVVVPQPLTREARFAGAYRRVERIEQVADVLDELQRAG